MCAQQRMCALAREHVRARAQKYPIINNHAQLNVLVACNTLYGAHSIKNTFLTFGGSTEHYVKPFKGERYTIVYYRWS